MVTESSVIKTNDDYKYSFEGLSTDVKPLIADYPDMKNGSTFLEMDSTKLWFYDQEHDAWVGGE